MAIIFHIVVWKSECERQRHGDAAIIESGSSIRYGGGATATTGSATTWPTNTTIGGSCMWCRRAVRRSAGTEERAGVAPTFFFLSFFFSYFNLSGRTLAHLPWLVQDSCPIHRLVQLVTTYSVAFFYVIHGFFYKNKTFLRWVYSDLELPQLTGSKAF